jgi:hypothetical protein
MPLKNFKTRSPGLSDPIFLFTLRVLFFVAGALVLASAWVLVPQWMSSGVNHVAPGAKPQRSVLGLFKPGLSGTIHHEKMKEEMVLPSDSLKKAKDLQSTPSSQEALNEKETNSKTVSMGLEEGVQAGESLAIISVQHIPGAEGEQILKIAIKSQSHEVISVSEVKVQVYFYDQIAGEVVASKSPVTSQWLNAAVDWKNGEPQLLQVTYQPSNNNPDARYLGYIVAVYYQGELQSYRADPPAITTYFPIKVYIGRNEF